MMEHIIKFMTAVLIVVFAFFMHNWITRYYDYRCGNCGEKFSLSIWEALFSVHMMGTKYVKCPNCGKWSWAKLTPKG
jgi:DNA-directed RNA polymerase subunit RPC12/RpoP